MKRLCLIFVVGLGLASLTGCSTPIYSARERGEIIARNIGFEYQAMQDDIDHALLLRPRSTLHRYNVR